MWFESRRILALMGDQKVTIGAFVGLLLFGSIQLLRARPLASRWKAAFIFGCAALWLLVVLAGAIRGDLAQWSSFAVFLFAVGIEEGSSCQPEVTGFPQLRRWLARNRVWVLPVPRRRPGAGDGRMCGRDPARSEQ